MLATFDFFIVARYSGLTWVRCGVPRESTRGLKKQSAVP